MEKGIHDLAYLIEKAKENNEPKPIVFLGAGASVSGGIPLASGIIKRILREFKDKPAIVSLSKEKKQNYYELMSALNAKERRKLFQDYIEEAKVNTAHIYLAQMVKLGYVDYVLTVNFDDLLSRACGLYNYTMPTYDISNINEFTTTTFQKQSIIYLHGQHYGEWLLNAQGELDKVKDRIPLLLNKICHDRTWIIAGYSGEDEVFNSIKNFASFDNELYWVNYLNNNPSEIVEKGLLNVCTKNAHSISGYDADTFFLDLHSKLNLPTPKIIDKPFSFLKSMMDKIQIPEEDNVIEDHKELYKSLSDRMEISNNWIGRAINEIQEEDSVEKFKQEIIEAYTKGSFIKNEKKFLQKISKNQFKEARRELSDFYIVWGDMIFDSAKKNESSKEYQKSFKKYKKALELVPENYNAHNNYGTSLLDFARLNSDESIFDESISQFQKAISLNDKKDFAYVNYGNALSALGNLKSDEEMLKLGIDNYKKALEINPEFDLILINYGISIRVLAKLNSDIQLYEKSILKFERAIELDPKNDNAYDNCGISVSNLAHLKKDRSIFERSFILFEKAIEINSKNFSAYDNYTAALLFFVDVVKNLKKEEIVNILLKAEKKAVITYHGIGLVYNLSCVYARMKEKEKALRFLKEALSKDQVIRNHILADEDWKHYLKDKDFKALLAKY